MEPQYQKNSNLENKTSILSVGTEVASGQIINTNASLIARYCSLHHLETTHHLAVPDHSEAILEALHFCTEKTDTVFITGGLGPTTDDFTRNVAALFLGLKLVFNPASHQKIIDRCQAFGIELKENQKQQCYFPEGAKIIQNHAGTANAFYVKWKGKNFFFLPGPPPEIEAVFEEEIHSILKDLFLQKTYTEKKELLLFQVLGQAESVVATITEEFWKKEPVELGYRIHFPYVEVKIWVLEKIKNQVTFQKKLKDFEGALEPYFLNQGPFDIHEKLLHRLSGLKFSLYDHSLGGAFSEKLFQIFYQKKAKTQTHLHAVYFNENHTPSENEDYILIHTQTASPYFKIKMDEKYVEAPLIISTHSNPKAFLRAQNIAIESVFLKWLQLLS